MAGYICLPVPSPEMLEAAHDWKDLDAGRKRTVKDGFGKEVQATLAPYTESYVTSYYAFQPDLSSPVDPNLPEAPMSKVTFFNLKPGGMPAVVATTKKTHAAMEKTHWTGNGCYSKR